MSFSAPHQGISVRRLSSWLCVSSLLLCLPSAAGQDPNAVNDQDEHRQLVLQYTKTNLELAELELEKALTLNERSPVIPKLAVERLRSNLEVAKEQYRQAQAETTEGAEKVRLRHAEEQLRLAEIDLQAGKTLAAQASISDLELRRLKLKHQLAQLNLAMLSHPTGYLTLFDSMQRQLERFGNEILSLDQRVSKLEASRLNR